MPVPRSLIFPPSTVLLAVYARHAPHRLRPECIVLRDTCSHPHLSRLWRFCDLVILCFSLECSQSLLPLTHKTEPASDEASFRSFSRFTRSGQARPYHHPSTAISPSTVEITPTVRSYSGGALGLETSSKCCSRSFESRTPTAGQRHLPVPFSAFAQRSAREHLSNSPGLLRVHGVPVRRIPSRTCHRLEPL